MDELKNIISNNRSLFDVAEPSSDHFSKFKDLLEQENKKQKQFSWTGLLKVASVVVLVILSSLYVGEHVFKLGKNLTVYENAEFKEAKTYYVHQVNNQINQIEQMQHLLSSEQRTVLVDEMTSMDQMYKKLQKDLDAMPNDPRIIEALLRHYQLKMDILNRIIGDLQNVKQLNPQNDESVEI